MVCVRCGSVAFNEDDGFSQKRCTAIVSDAGSCEGSCEGSCRRRPRLRLRKLRSHGCSQGCVSALQQALSCLSICLSRSSLFSEGLQIGCGDAVGVLSMRLLAGLVVNSPPERHHQLARRGLTPTTTLPTTRHLCSSFACAHVKEQRAVVYHSIFVRSPALWYCSPGPFSDELRASFFPSNRQLTASSCLVLRPRCHLGHATALWEFVLPPSDSPLTLWLLTLNCGPPMASSNAIPLILQSGRCKGCRGCHDNHSRHSKYRHLLSCKHVLT